MHTSLAQRRRDDLTFKANLRSTRYGWLRLTPAYSVHLVRELVQNAKPEQDHVLDPFCGTGTTALVCAELGISATTTDINPFLVWLASCKCARYTDEHLSQLPEAAKWVRDAICSVGESTEWVPPIHQIEKWWDRSTIHALARAMAVIRTALDRYPAQVRDLLRIAFCRVMIDTANVSFGHQSMSFRSPGSDTSLFESNPAEDLAAHWDRAVADLVRGASVPLRSKPSVLLCDARHLGDTLSAEQYTLVITSPPYPNRMSYIRELRPYMYWLGYLRDGKEAGELDWQAIGGTWGAATSRLNDWDAGKALDAFPVITATCRQIAGQSDLLARYVARYFVDSAEHCRQLYRVVKPGGTVHYIVGNSKFYDVVLPVEQFYAQILSASGFKQVDIIQIRKRTSKRELFEYRVTAKKP